MHVRTRQRAGAATTGIAIAGIAAVAATPLAPVTDFVSESAVSRDVDVASTVRQAVRSVVKNVSGRRPNSLSKQTRPLAVRSL